MRIHLKARHHSIVLVTFATAALQPRCAAFVTCRIMKALFGECDTFDHTLSCFFFLALAFPLLPCSFIHLFLVLGKVSLSLILHFPHPSWPCRPPPACRLLPSAILSLLSKAGKARQGKVSQDSVLDAHRHSFNSLETRSSPFKLILSSPLLYCMQYIVIGILCTTGGRVSIKKKGEDKARQGKKKKRRKI
ncbi:hypothetical protein HDV57DRAFT_501257, partial [Trichoderma longibrachiatum]